MAVAVTTSYSNKPGNSRNVARNSSGVPYVVLENTSTGGIEVYCGVEGTFSMNSIYGELSAPGIIYRGQAFTGNGKSIDKVLVRACKVGAPTGNLVLKIYSHAGTYGYDSRPSGSALATSAGLDVSTLSLNDNSFVIQFPESFATVKGTFYVLVAEYTSGNSLNRIKIGMSPQALGAVSCYSLNGTDWSFSTNHIDFGILSVAPGAFFGLDIAGRPRSAGRYINPAIAIDSAGIIHIAYMDDNGAAPSVRYVTFNTATGAFSGDVAIVADLGNDATASGLTCAVAVDSNDKPHIAYVGSPANMGSTYYTVWYANKTGGAWSTPVQVYGAAAQRNSHAPDIVIDGDNKPCISFWYQELTGMPNGFFVAGQGNANNATGFTLKELVYAGTVTFPNSSMAVDSSGNHLVAFFDTLTVRLHKHNYGDPWTTWQSYIDTGAVSGSFSLVANGADLYLFYENESKDICYRTYTGTWGSGSLSAEVVLEAGTFNTVKAKFGFWVDNDSEGSIVTSESPYVRRSAVTIDYVFLDEIATPDLWFSSLALVSGDWTTKPLKVYTGGSWVAKPLKAYVGGSWVAKPIKHWT